MVKRRLPSSNFDFVRGQYGNVSRTVQCVVHLPINSTGYSVTGEFFGWAKFFKGLE